MKRISLHGSYFGNNYGDILLMNIFAKWTRDCLQGCVINMPLAHRSLAKDLDYDSTGFLNLIRSNVLVFCGGGYFGEQPHNPRKWARRNFLRHGIVGLVALIFNIPYAIIGVEFGPISSSWFRIFCIFLAKHAKIVVVRNQNSKEFLQSNGVDNVILSNDAVLSLSDIVEPKENQGSKKQILIHFSGLKSSPEILKKLVISVIRSADYCIGNYSITFISDTPGKVYSGSQYEPLFKFLDDNSINYGIKDFNNCNSLIELINQSDYIITSKLHVGITAAALNKRVLSLWAHPKTKRLHSQIDNSSFCIKFSDVETIDIEALLTKFFTCASYHLPSSIKQNALINRDKLFEFLNQYQ